MANDEQTVEGLIAANLRRLRENAGLSQDEVVRTARARGIPWARSTLAAIETGTRTISVAELILLPTVLGVTMDELLAGTGRVRVGESTPKLEVVRRLLRGEELGRVTVGELGWPGTPFDTDAWAQAWEKKRRRLEQLAPGITFGQAVEAEEAAKGDAEQKAARRLGVDAGELSVAAFGRWGRSLTDERDDRLAERLGPDTPASAQARGHITRELLAELEPILRKKGR